MGRNDQEELLAIDKKQKPLPLQHSSISLGSIAGLLGTISEGMLYSNMKMIASGLSMKITTL